MKFVLALVLCAAPLFGQCTSGFLLNKSVISFPASTANGIISDTVNVTYPAGCQQLASAVSVDMTWLKADVTAQGSGTGIITVSATQNPTNGKRTGTVLIGDGKVTVTQLGATCTYAFNPSSLSAPVGGGSGIANVVASCVWTTAVSDRTWITVDPGTQGTFNGPLPYTIQPNSCVASRSGFIGVGFPASTVAAQFQISQAGSTSNLTLSPPSQNISAAAQDGKITVNTGPLCNWSAFVDVSWLHFTLNNSGTGNGSLTYHADANPSSTRAGHIQIGPQTFTVTQDAIAAPPIQITRIQNAGSYAEGGVSPGEIISLFGTNMGPAIGVPLQLTADGKSITKTLGGVQVFFDDTPAPLTYASATQINAVVPYGLAGKFATLVHVEYGGASSATTQVTVLKASPGIFTQDASGTGAGAILNQDLSTNTAANRAARGSTVVIYCTGGGATDPASVDALITPLTAPFPVLTQDVSVLIGGTVAKVTYSGAAPGLIGGVTQINAIVPDGIAPSAAVPVVVGIGALPSQPAVTLAVK